MSWQRHEPWIFLSLMLLFSLLIIRVLPSTGDAVKPLPGTLAHPPHVIDYRDAWKNSLSDAPASSMQGDLVFVRNGYYVFEDGSYVTDANGNLVSAVPHVHTDSITGNVVYEEPNAQDYQPQLVHLQYSPIVETCRDSDKTRGSISNENPLDGHNSYFQPGIVTMDVLRQRVLGEAVLSQDIIHGVQLQDRCYSAKNLGYETQPSYRGVVFEANCAALKGLKNGYITQAVEHALAEDAASDADLSFLKKFYTAQFCQKSTSLITSGSAQTVVQYVACGREGTQGYCQ
ncbi:MAG: hypothetical protein AABX70_06955 [Nanoarchaeota archaeon]